VVTRKTGGRKTSPTKGRLRASQVGSRLKGSPIAILFMAVLVDMLGFGIVIPVLPFYALEMGATALEVTLLIASFSAMQMAATPIWGRVSDTRGRRPLIIAGLFASAVSYLIFGLANSLALLLLSRLAAGAAGGTISVAHAYVADTTKAEERAHGMGLIGAAAGLGVMLGPAVGGFFSTISLAAPGFVAAGLCGLNGIAAIFLLPESRSKEKRTGERKGQTATLHGWARTMMAAPLSLVLGVYFLGITSFTAMTALLALYFEAEFGIGAREMGFMFAIAGGVTVVVRGVALGRLVRRFGEIATVRMGAIGLGLSFLLIPLVPGFGWAMAVVPLYAFGAGTMFPALATLTSFASDDDSQGSVLGGSQLVGGLGRVAGPLWAGFLFQEIAFDTPFHVATGLAVIAVILTVRIPRTLQSRRDAPVAIPDPEPGAEASIAGNSPQAAE
jgi:MFS family permease